MKIDIRDLKDLRDICSKVLDKHKNSYSKRHLPTVEGFFFGSTSYDEYYYGDLKETIKDIDKTLKNIEDSDEDPELYYYASW